MKETLLKTSFSSLNRFNQDAHVPTSTCSFSTTKNKNICDRYEHDCLLLLLRVLEGINSLPHTDLCTLLNEYSRKNFEVQVVDFCVFVITVPSLNKLKPF